jgi:hypothetical protein
MEIQPMAYQSIIFHGNFLPPLLPLQELLGSKQDMPLFASKGADFENFKKKITSSWKAILSPLEAILLRNSSEVKVAIFISGPALLWLQKHSPELSAQLQKLNDTQAVQWVTGPLDHSLRFIYHRPSLQEQFEKMGSLLEKTFGQQRNTASMPGFFYNTYFGYLANRFEVNTLLAPSRNGFVASHVPHNPGLKLVHVSPWSITVDSARDQALLVSMDMDSPSQFLNWFSENQEQHTWLWPDALASRTETPAWDVQESLAQAPHLGRNLEALEHPFCKNWIGHLKSLAETGKGGSELHHAGLFDALLGYVPDHKPLEVYRNLIMRKKLAS